MEDPKRVLHNGVMYILQERLPPSEASILKGNS